MSNPIVYDPYTETGLAARAAAAESALKASGGNGVAGVQDLNFGYNDVSRELSYMGPGPRFVSETPPEFVVEGSEETGYKTRWLTPDERQADHQARVAHNDLELARYGEQITEAEFRLRTDIELLAHASGAVDWSGQSDAIVLAQREAEQRPAYQHTKPMMTPVEGFLLSFFASLILATWAFGDFGIFPVAVLSLLLAFIGTGLIFFSGAFAGMQ